MTLLPSSRVVGRAPEDLDNEEVASLLRARGQAALARLAPGSKRQYAAALAKFESWVPSAPDLPLSFPSGAGWLVVVALLRAGPLVAATVVEAYLSQGCIGLSPATVAQRAAAIRWAFRLAREGGLVAWDLHVRAPHVRTYRDTRGPALSTCKALLEAATEQGGVLGARDGVLVVLLFVLGLRRGEIANLRVGDFDRAGRRLQILGKGRLQPEFVSLPDPVNARLCEYLAVRGDPSPTEPMLASHDRAHRGTGGLTDSGIYRRLRALAAAAGCRERVTPHGLRHASITQAFDALDEDVRHVRSFARHAKVETTIIYDDRRQDIGGRISAGLADLLTTPTEPATTAPLAGEEPANRHSRALKSDEEPNS